MTAALSKNEGASLLLTDVTCGGCSKRKCAVVKEGETVDPAPHFPAKAARKPDDPRLAELVGDLSIKDSQFGQW